MDKFSQALAFAKSFWFWFSQAAAPYLIAVGIPSVAAALANKPKASGFVAFLLKASRFIGVLTHNDEPGTLKAPMGLGAVAKGLLALFKSKAGAAAALIAILSVGVGCAQFYAWEAKHPTATRELKCGESAVIEGMPNVLGDVLASLSGGAPDWDALGKLEAEHGGDLVGCAVKAALAGAEDVKNPDAGTSPAMRGMASRVGANALAYLNARGLK